MAEKVIICLSSYYKGYDFLDEAKKLGNKVILITSEKLREENWPWHAIDETYYMPEIAYSKWNTDDLVKGVAHLLKTRNVCSVIALDDYDVEKGALLRETFRIGGMGQTTHHYFRDKLAMRIKAKDSGINVPEFTAIFNNDVVNNFVAEVPGPWVLKPRSEASATGIKKISDKEELWKVIDQLGDERHLFLLESFKPGDVFHVDSIVYQGAPVFTCCSQYVQPPMSVSHEGGVFRTRTLASDSEKSQSLTKLNTELLSAFGLVNGTSHSEYIKGVDGKYYFLETSSRVGGAHISEMIEAARGINIWREWARLETCLINHTEYSLPNNLKEQFGGLIISLIKDKTPDSADFQCAELDHMIPIDYHVGMVYVADTEQKILDRLEEATSIITQKLLKVLPPKERPKA